MPAGTIVPSGSLVSPGGQQGIPGPNAVSTDAGNQATFGSDSRLYVPDPTPTIVTIVGQRAFNAIGNPNAEICQRNVSNALTNPATATFLEDRWSIGRGGTFAINAWRTGNTPISIPGTNFCISNAFFRITLTTAQASLGATDYFQLVDYVEGPNLRELISDVHSALVLVRSSVAGLKFGVTLRDGSTVKSLTKLNTIASANTWTLCQMPNLPLWDAGATWNITPGNVGYSLGICLGAGSTLTAPANDTWQSGNFVGATGQTNFMGQAVNSTFDIAYVSHVPGPNAEILDCPFTQNYDACLRYYAKSYPYATKPGTANVEGYETYLIPLNTAVSIIRGSTRFPKSMAKYPTVTMYSYDGTANGVSVVITGQTASNFGVSSVSATDKGMGAITLTTSCAASYYCAIGHYTADTGW